MLHVQSLSKFYGRQPALHSVSFFASRGEVIGVLGPHGSGKTTLLKLLSGCLRPNAGVMQVSGVNLVDHRRQAQALIGYVPAGAPVFAELSVQEQLRLIADLRGIRRTTQQALLSRSVCATGLQHCLTALPGDLDKGRRLRLGLAQAILHDPALLLLDDPLVGLDLAERIALRDLLRRQAHRSAIILTSTSADEIEWVCDRVLVLMNGAVQADLRLAQLHTTGRAVLVLDSPVKLAAQHLRGLAGVCSVTPIASDCGYPAYRVVGDGRLDLCPAIFALASAQQWPLRELRPDHRTLTDVLAQLAAGAAAQV